MKSSLARCAAVCVRSRAHGQPRARRSSSIASAQQAGAPAEPPEEMIVTSSLVPQPKREIGTAVSVLDFGEMQLRGYTEVADVLRTQPGISVSNSGGVGKSDVGPHSRRGKLSHDLDHRRREGGRCERAASLARFRQPARDQRLRSHRGAARAAGLHVRRGRRRRREHHDEARRGRARWPRRARVRRILDSQDRRGGLGRQRPRRLLRVRHRSSYGRLQRAIGRHDARRRRRREEHDRAREARLERDRRPSAPARRAQHRRVDDVRRVFHDDDVRSRE